MVVDKAKELDVPILLAGDVFDRWDAPAELVNHVIRWLDGILVYAVPGNHDLPNHSLADVRRSAYWTLVEAGSVQHVTDVVKLFVGGRCEAFVYGFAHGVEVVDHEAIEIPGIDVLKVALIHDYIWFGPKPPYPGASPDKHCGEWGQRLGSMGYDAAVFGDNHSPWYTNNEGGTHPAMLNCGCLTRRRADEVVYQPHVNLLYSNGTFDREPIDTTGDVWRANADREATEILDTRELVESLKALADTPLNFTDAVMHHLRVSKAADPLKRFVLSCLGVEK